MDDGEREIKKGCLLNSRDRAVAARVRDVLRKVAASLTEEPDGRLLHGLALEFMMVVVAVVVARMMRGVLSKKSRWCGSIVVCGGRVAGHLGCPDHQVVLWCRHTHGHVRPEA